MLSQSTTSNISYTYNRTLYIINCITTQQINYIDIDDILDINIKRNTTHMVQLVSQLNLLFIPTTYALPAYNNRIHHLVVLLSILI